MQKVAVTQEIGPSRPPGASTASGAENFIAGHTVPAATALLVPPGPVTFSVNVYLAAVFPASAGSATGMLTFRCAVSAAHATVLGRPATAGVTDSTHVADRWTLAAITVAPPADGRSPGDAANPLMPGAASLMTTVTGLALAFPPGPLASRLNR